MLESVRALAIAESDVMTRLLCENKVLRQLELSAASLPRALPMMDDLAVRAIGSEAPTYTADMRTVPFGGVNCKYDENVRRIFCG